MSPAGFEPEDRELVGVCEHVIATRNGAHAMSTLTWKQPATVDGALVRRFFVCALCGDALERDNRAPVPVRLRRVERRGDEFRFVPTGGLS